VEDEILYFVVSRSVEAVLARSEIFQGLVAFHTNFPPVIEVTYLQGRDE
jgi:hypothetical protein